MPEHVSATSIRKTIVNTIENSNKIKAQKEMYNYFEGQYKISRSNLFPQIDVKSVIENREKPGIYPNKLNSVIELSASIPIWDAQRYEELTTNKAQKEVGKIEFDYSKKRIIQIAASTHIDIIQQEKVLELTKNISNKFAQQRKEMYQRFKAGERTITDVRQVKARLARYLARLSRERETMRMLERRYKELTNSRGRVSLQPTQINTKKYIKQKIYLNNITEVNLSKQRLNLSLSKYRAQKLMHLPTVSLVATVDNNHDQLYGTGLSDFDNKKIQLTLKLPLFSSFSTSNKIKSSYTQVRLNEIIHKQQKLEASEKVREIVFQINNSHKIIKNLQWAKYMAKKALDGITTEFAAGNKSGQDLLDSEEELFLAELEHIKEDGRLDKLKIEHLALINKIDEYFKL